MKRDEQDDTRRLKILMAAGQYWRSPVHVGCHHLAKYFANRGHDVAFIAPSITPFHFLWKPNKLRLQRLSNYLQSGEFAMSGRVWAYVPFTLFNPQNVRFLNSQWTYDNYYKWSIPNVIRKIRRRGFDQCDLLYIRDIAQYFWLEAIRPQCSFYRMADNDAGFASYSATTEVLERRLTSAVDVTVYTAKALENRARMMGAGQSYFLPNGVDFCRFNTPAGLPPEYKGLRRPIAVYSGTINYWLDKELLKKITTRLADVSFVFVGPDAIELRSELVSGNVTFVGPRPFDEIPAFLQHADVGLIPFDVQKHRSLIECVNPLKLYEYCAAGLPVVSTFWKEMETLSSPAMLCHDAEEFCLAVRKLTSRQVDREALREFGRLHDWSRHCDGLMSTLESVRRRKASGRLPG